MISSMIMVMGSLITLSSKSWMVAWVGLEINTLGFILILIKYSNYYDSPLKYFIVQTFTSNLLLMSILYFSNLNNMMLNLFPNPNTLMTAIISMKLGMIPFHYWMLEILKKINWITYFIMITWQKLAPMMLLFSTTTLITVYFLSLLNSMGGAILGTIQKNIMKVILYSSISHMGWMMSPMLMKSEFWLIYLAIYSLLTFVVIKNFVYTKFSNETFILANKFLLIIILMMSILSLSGFPPFSGFISKWVVISILAPSEMFLMLILVSSSTISIYFYIKLFSPSLFIYIKTYKSPLLTSFHNLTSTKIYYFTFMSSMLGTMIIMLY
uniref:NADH-ubiquinone oxidoreductase chain 2 n=1 Tax=Pseudogarypus banksi TaxID=1131925 RepID=H9MFI2_9ARAC|nr:NADH dehydrogenase subunit 2 [Pseudogarypus banksi]